jgi:hypothetical protein
MDQTIVHGYTIMVGVTQQCGIDFNGWKTWASGTWPQVQMRELGTDVFFFFLLPHPAAAFFGTLRRCTKAAAGGESEVYVWSAARRRRRSGVIVHQRNQMP